MTSELDKPIGNIEGTKLTASSVKVESVRIEGVTNKKGEAVGRKVVLSVKHPESPDAIELSNVQYLKNKAVKSSALWYNEDTEGNIAKNSALADTMRFYKVSTLKDFVEKYVDTIVDEKGYLTIKSY